MIRQGVQKEIDDYFDSSRLGQSYLKNLIKGVSSLKEEDKKLYYQEKGHFIIGSGVDTLLSQGAIEFTRQYHPSLVKKPSDAVMSIIQRIFDRYCESDLVLQHEVLGNFTVEILESAEYHKYQTRWTDETMIKNIILHGSPYFEDLIQSNGKQVVSKIECDIIDNTVMAFKTSDFTGKYFKDSEHIEIYYQVPIYFTYMGEDCKSLLDMVIIDRQARTVQPIDFKTTGGDVRFFASAVRSLRYDIQGAFYTEALRCLTTPTQINPAGISPIEELCFPHLKGYKVLPFKFMVETTGFTTDKITGETRYNQGSPLMFTLSEENMKVGKFGRPELKINIVNPLSEGIEEAYPIKYAKISGFIDGIELFKWYELNGFEIDKDIVECNGDILI